jgi:hypothetical protein
MNSIYTDHSLRQALHKLYVANFNVLKEFPDAFDNNHATRMLTSLMGSRLWSWRVIGITVAALELFAANDFQAPTRKIQRGHRHGRADTARLLFGGERPLKLDDFFDVFLKRDQTVLMVVKENPARSSRPFPKFIPIKLSAQVFPCASLVGWHHRKHEVEFLRDLHSKYLAGVVQAK